MLTRTTNIDLIFELDQFIFKNQSYTHNTYKQMLNNNLFFLIEFNQQNIGFLIFNKTDGDLELIKIGIMPNYQNQKIATNALKKAIDLLDYNHIFLEVSNLNIAAIKLYQNLGFSIVNIRKNYYHDNSDAIIMKLTKP